VPFLPGVTDTADPTYTSVGTSVTGFVASGVGHVCAAVPTVKTLFRFCRNGFTRKTKTTSGYVRDGTIGSSGKRDYKSLQDSKNSSTYSRKTLNSTQQRHKESSRGKRDPFHIPSMIDVDVENEAGLVELQPVKAQSNGRADTQQARNFWIGRAEAQFPTTVRELSELEVDDSASNKARFHRNTC